jgi:HPt (histidine-containing phosphotransfer) domain-containing protein
MTANDPAFNVTDALRRLVNNKNLYKKLLNQFAAEYANFGEKLTKAVEEKNMDEGTHLAHTMKGLAGNLGADALQEASKNLEALFKAGVASADFGPALAAFVAEMNRAVDEARAGVDMG